MAPPQLVDLVDEDQRVGDAASLQTLDGLAGHRADVGAAVALDLGNVGQAV